MKFLEKIGDLLRNIFSKSQVVSEAAVKAINILKTAVESPLIGFVTFAIPGNTDDKIVKALQDVLPRIALDLNLVNSYLQNKSSQEILIALTVYLKEKTKDDRSGTYERLAAVIYQRMMGSEKPSYDDARELTQYIYKELKRKN